MNCVNCRSEIAPGKNFCKRCGKRVVVEPTTNIPPTSIERALPTDPNFLANTQPTSTERILPASPIPILESGQKFSSEIVLPANSNSTLATPPTRIDNNLDVKSTSDSGLKVSSSGAHQVYRGTVVERIRKSTEMGGLGYRPTSGKKILPSSSNFIVENALPVGFDDKEGDWITIHSNNLFERLYLDYQLYEQITPEMVKGNYEVLNRFWQDKVDLLNRGQRQIISKYDPEHKSEEVVKGFAKRLKEAFDVLSKPNGIRNYFNELDRKRKEKGEDSLREIIDTALADGMLEIAETQMVFDKGRNTELTEEEQAEFVASRLKDNQFYPIGTPTGETPKARLLSVRWATKNRWERERLNELQKQQATPAFQPQIPSYTEPSPLPPQTQKLPTNPYQSRSLFLVAIVGGATVAVVTLFISYFYFFGNPSTQISAKTNETRTEPLIIKSNPNIDNASIKNEPTPALQVDNSLQPKAPQTVETPPPRTNDKQIVIEQQRRELEAQRNELQRQRAEMEQQRLQEESQKQREEAQRQRQKEELEKAQQEALNKQRELDERRQRFEEEQAKKRQLEEEQARKRQLEEQTKKKQIEEQRYSGPSSGTITWEGQIDGLQLVEIDNGRASIGTVTGSLPGVACLIQPTDKKVIIADPPRPSNKFQRLVFRVQGKGRVLVKFTWAVQ